MLICEVALDFNQKESIYSLLTMMQIHVNLDHKSTSPPCENSADSGRGSETRGSPSKLCGLWFISSLQRAWRTLAPSESPGCPEQDMIEDFKVSLQCSTSIMKNSKTLLYLHYN